MLRSARKDNRPEPQERLGCLSGAFCEPLVGAPGVNGKRWSGNALGRGGSVGENSFQRVLRIILWHARRAWSFLVRPLARVLLIFRYKARQRNLSGRVNFSTRSSSGLGIRACDVVFISLSHRLDRRDLLYPEFEKIGVKDPVHFNAVLHPDGRLGCALSHFTVLENFRQAEKLLMVCEDDIQFVASAEVIDGLIDEFVANPRVDILQLDYAAEHNPVPISSFLAVSDSAHRTGCYIVKPSAQRRLVRSHSLSVRLLLRGRRRNAAVDVVWQRAQRWGLIFAVPRQKVVVQRSGHSDVVGRFVKLGN